MGIKFRDKPFGEKSQKFSHFLQFSCSEPINLDCGRLDLELIFDEKPDYNCHIFLQNFNYNRVYQCMATFSESRHPQQRKK